jgi:hypothetical protein
MNAQPFKFIVQQKMQGLVFETGPCAVLRPMGQARGK